MDKKDWHWFDKQGSPDIGYKFNFCDDGFGFFYFENNSDDTTIIANVHLTTFDGCKLRKNPNKYDKIKKF